METKVIENIDELYKMLNGYGRFQRIVNVMLACMIIPQSFHVLIMYFVAQGPKWRCVENSTVCQLNGVQDSHNTYRCNIPHIDWKYANPLEYSIISEFSLDCEKEWIVHLATSVHYIGWATGAIILGMAANKYGRKNVIFSSCLIISITGTVSACIPNIYLFLICRFVIGFATPGSVSVLYMMMGELVDDEHRSFASIVITATNTAALSLLGLKAIYIRRWRNLLLACSLPYVFLLVFYKFVPESIRWLYLHNKEDEMMKECKRIAKWNQIELHNEFTILPPPTLEENRKIDTGFLDLFKTFTQGKIILALMFSWFMVNALYFGFFLTADDFHISMHLSFILFSVVEIPSSLLGCYCSDRFGRRVAVPASMAMGAVTALSLAFLPVIKKLIIPRIILGMLGQGLFIVSFNCLIPWTVEILTTDTRALGMGVVACTGRVGGTLCPWIANALKVVQVNAPFFAIGSLAICTTLVMVYLPETKGVPMKDVEELHHNVESDEEVSKHLLKEMNH